MTRALAVLAHAREARDAMLIAALLAGLRHAGAERTLRRLDRALRSPTE